MRSLLYVWFVVMGLALFLPGSAHAADAATSDPAEVAWTVPSLPYALSAHGEHPLVTEDKELAYFGAALAVGGLVVLIVSVVWIHDIDDDFSRLFEAMGALLVGGMGGALVIAGLARVIVGHQDGVSPGKPSLGGPMGARLVVRF